MLPIILVQVLAIVEHNTQLVLDQVLEQFGHPLSGIMRQEKT
jgi:hypothetical protein